MSKIDYSDKLKHPKWQKKRLGVLQRDNWVCQLCGDSETTLHVHHKKYNGEPWDQKMEDLISYCEYCHYIVEAFKDGADDCDICRVRRIESSKCPGDFVFFIQARDQKFDFLCLVALVDGKYSYFPFLNTGHVQNLSEFIKGF